MTARHSARQLRASRSVPLGSRLGGASHARVKDGQCTAEGGLEADVMQADGSNAWSDDALNRTSMADKLRSVRTSQAARDRLAQTGRLRQRLDLHMLLGTRLPASPRHARLPPAPAYLGPRPAYPPRRPTSERYQYPLNCARGEA